MREIKLTQGKVALVDDEDFELLSQWRWFYETHGYASRDIYLGGGRKNQQSKRIKMHRLIMDCSNDKEVDHIDGNGLNNQKYNLRICTHAENQKNLRRPITSTSGYKGVTWDKNRKKWVAYIWSGKSINLGGFDSKEKAALAYDKAAEKYHGEFARLNNV